MLRRRCFGHAGASEHVLKAGGFSSEAPFKRAREQAFDASALLRVTT